MFTCRFAKEVQKPWHLWAIIFAKPNSSTEAKAPQDAARQSDVWTGTESCRRRSNPVLPMTQGKELANGKMIAVSFFQLVVCQEAKKLMPWAGTGKHWYWGAWHIPAAISNCDRYQCRTCQCYCFLLGGSCFGGPFTFLPPVLVLFYNKVNQKTFLFLYSGTLYLIVSLPLGRNPVWYICWFPWWMALASPQELELAESSLLVCTTDLACC